MLLAFSRASLVVLTLFGGWYLHAFSKTITKLTAQSLLSSGIAYHNVYTGITKIDTLLSILLTFFWPVVDGEHPDLCLTSILFAGQAVAAWTLTMLEGMRTGNSGRVVSLTTMYGLLMQSCGMAFASPAYLLLSLYTAGTVTTPTARDIAVPESALRALPYSIGLGFITPTVVMSLPSPSYLTQQQKMYAILTWQAFPLWTQLIQWLFQNTVFRSTSNETSAKHQLKLLRRVYKFALYFSVQVHIAMRFFSVATLLFPGLFTGYARATLSPQHIFLPQNPFNAAKNASTVADSALWVLQWDFLISGVAYWVWGLSVKYSDAKTSKRCGIGDILSDIFIRPNLMGHMACALSYVWERDEVAFKKANDAMKENGATKENGAAKGGEMKTR